MSTTAQRREPELIKQVSRYSFVADGGECDGINVGDRYEVEYEGDQFEVRVTDTSDHKSVVEVTDTGLEHYGTRSLSSYLRTLV